MHNSVFKKNGEIFLLSMDKQFSVGQGFIQCNSSHFVLSICVKVQGRRFDSPHGRTGRSMKSHINEGTRVFNFFYPSRRRVQDKAM